MVEVCEIVYQLIKVIAFLKIHIIGHELLIQNLSLTQSRNRSDNLVHMHDLISNGILRDIQFKLGVNNILTHEITPSFYFSQKTVYFTLLALSSLSPK